VDNRNSNKDCKNVCQLKKIFHTLKDELSKQGEAVGGQKWSSRLVVDSTANIKL